MANTQDDTDHALTARLRELDSCVVSDACDVHGLSPVLTRLKPMWEGARVAGRVVTVQLAEVSPDRRPPPVHLGVRAIQSCGPGDVIVIANDGRTGMGGWGGLLSLAATSAGVGGVVLDGACRDVDEARDLKFPVFALSGVVRTARGRVHEIATGDPVAIGEVTVSTGDFVIADGSGVVVLPHDRAAEIVATAEGLKDREDALAAQLRNGAPPAEVLGGGYEKMLVRGTD